MGSVVDTPFGPLVTEVPLPRAPLVFVVVQARFERVVSIANEEFIAGFQETLRSRYPRLRREQETSLLIGPEGRIAPGNVGTLWRLDDRPEDWQVTLAPDFVALSTHSYTSRRDLLARFDEVLRAASQFQLRFCDRLGVRYVDRVADPALLDRLADLVRPEILGAALVHPGEEDVDGVQAFADSTYRIGKTVELHGRWGVLPPQATFDPAVEPAVLRSWVLDIDAFTTESVPFDPSALGSQVEGLCERIYRFFRWSVSDEFLRAHGGEL